jgi:hypothetical protein
MSLGVAALLPLTVRKVSMVEQGVTPNIEKTAFRYYGSNTLQTSSTLLFSQ